MLVETLIDFNQNEISLFLKDELTIIPGATYGGLQLLLLS